MPEITAIFWRSLTKADFFNIERSPKVGPSSGGGQTYISISFGSSMSHAEFGRFLGVRPATTIRTARPERSIDVCVLADPSLSAPLTFGPRYTDMGHDDRYRIMRQNRRRARHERHPAWTLRYGFPSAPSSVKSKDDQDMPDLSSLKIFIAKSRQNKYFAGYTNQVWRPNALPPELGVLFSENKSSRPVGIIHLKPRQLTTEALARALRHDGSAPEINQLGDSEIDGALDLLNEILAPASAPAPARPRGQGYRATYEERRAIELRAMEVVRYELVQRGWLVEDVSASESYDFHCSQTDSDAVLYVEVKGTTGAGSEILLTRNEVDLAHRNHPNTALFVVSNIRLARKAGKEPIASGGTLRELAQWDPHGSSDLQAMAFRFLLP